MNDNQVNDLKQLVVKPEAELELGPRDMVLNSGELVELELFGNLKKSISVEKFPGSILLRNYQQGEVICRSSFRCRLGTGRGPLRFGNLGLIGLFAVSETET